MAVLARRWHQAAPGPVDRGVRLSAETPERSRPRFAAPAMLAATERRLAVRPADLDGGRRWRSADRSPLVCAPTEHERAGETRLDQAAAEARCTGYGD